MKKKIRVIDKISTPGKTKIEEKEITIRDIYHFEVQKNSRGIIYRNRKKYYRPVDKNRDY